LIHLLISCSWISTNEPEDHREKDETISLSYVILYYSKRTAGGGNALNMRLKYRWASLIVVLMILVLGTIMGCSRRMDGPREVLQQSIQKEKTVTTSVTESRFQLNVEMESDQPVDPQLEGVLGALQGIRLQVKTTSDHLEKESLLEGHVEAGGVLLNFEMFMTEEMLALRVPALTTILNQPRFQHQYILVGMEDLMGQMSAEERTMFKEVMNRFSQQETNDELNQLVAETLLEAIGDDAMEDLGEVTIELGKRQEKVRQIAIHLEEAEIRSLSLAFVNLLSEDIFRDLLYDMELSASSAMSREIFEAELDRSMEELSEIMNESLTAFFSMVDMEESELVLTLSLTSDHQVVRTAFISRLKLSPEPDVTLRVYLDTAFDTISQNEPVTVNVPEMTPDNTMDLMELLFMMMFGL